MNLKKLQTGFSNTSSDALESFIQSARVNEELAMMNEEITFDKIKKFLDDTFQSNSNYRLFNPIDDLVDYEGLVVPANNHDDWWNKDAYCYFDPKKRAYFYAIPASIEEAKYFNVKFRIVTGHTAMYKENISFASQMIDVKDKVDFYINSISFLQDITEKIEFNDLEVHYSWFSYSNMKFLTEECIHKDQCKNQNCPMNKCANYHSMIEYTENMYKANGLIDNFVSAICKDKHIRLTELKFVPELNEVWYDFGSFALMINLPKRNDYKKSSAEIKFIVSNSTKVIAKYKAKVGKNGYELIELYNKMFMDYVTKKVNISMRIIKSNLLGK